MQYLCVTIPPPAVRPTLVRQLDMGSLTCAQIWVLAVHRIWVLAVHRRRGSGTNKPAQELIRDGGRVGGRGTEKHLFLTLPHRRIDARVFGFEFRPSNHWATTSVKHSTGFVGVLHFLDPNRLLTQSVLTSYWQKPACWNKKQNACCVNISMSRFHVGLLRVQS